MKKIIFVLPGRCRGCDSHGASLPLALAMAMWMSSAAAFAADWPMLGCNPQRTGYTPEIIEFPYAFAWEARLEPDRVSLKSQVIVAGGRAFIASKSGHLFAFDAKSGKELWRADCGPCEHTVGVENGRVFVGCLDGTVRAFDCETGKSAWGFNGDSGFTGAVLPVAGRVFIGSRAGIVYALDQATGKSLWRRDLGAPIFNTPAFDAGRVFIGAEDMKLRCLDAETGELIWTSDKLYGQSFRQYYPVVTQGRVLVQVMPVDESVGEFGLFTWDPAAQKGAGGEAWVAEALEKLFNGQMPEELMIEQDNIVALLEKDNPHWQRFYVLDEKTGRQQYVAPSWKAPTSGGPGFAPVVDYEGKILVPCGGFNGSGRAGRFDLDKGRVTDILFGPKCRMLVGRKTTGWKWETHSWDENLPIPFNSHGGWKGWGSGNGDEVWDLSCAGPVVFMMNPRGNMIIFCGTFDLRTRTWTQLSSSDITADGQTTAETPFWDNCHNRNNAVSISDGMFFHNSQHCIWAWRGNLQTDGAIPAPAGQSNKGVRK